MADDIIKSALEIAMEKVEKLDAEGNGLAATAWTAPSHWSQCRQPSGSVSASSTAGIS